MTLSKAIDSRLEKISTSARSLSDSGRSACNSTTTSQPRPGLRRALELLVAAQRGGQRGEQLVGRQLRLRLVVVDVVLDDDAALGRLAGLPGAQDDADGLVLEFAADIFDQFEAGDVGL